MTQANLIYEVRVDSSGGGEEEQINTICSLMH